MKKILKFKVLILFFSVLYICDIKGASVISQQMAMANKAFNTNQFETAIRHLDIVIKERSNYTDAFVLKGKCKIELDAYHEALDNFMTANNLNPQEAEFLYYKGMCEWKLKRIGSAIQSLEKSLIYNPDNFLAFKVLGSIYYELNMIPVAKVNFDKAIDIQPDFSVNFFNKIKVEEYAEAYKIAIRAAARDVSTHPNEARPLFYKAILKAISGDNWGAYVDFENVIKKDASIPVIYYYKGYVEYNIKKFSQALEDINKYYKNNPNDGTVVSMMQTIKEILNIRIIVEDDDNKTVYIYAQKMPEFEGGQSELMKYIAENINYPKSALAENIEGKVVLSFIIDTKGYIGGIDVVNSIGGGCEEEAIRVVSAMPKWKPGSENGKTVPVRYTLPITFKLSNN